MTFSLLCNVPSRYCIEYRNGTLHDVLTFELIVVLSAFAAIFGYLRASSLYQVEEDGNQDTIDQNADSLGGSVPSLNEEENIDGEGNMMENLIADEAGGPQNAA